MFRCVHLLNFIRCWWRLQRGSRKRSTQTFFKIVLQFLGSLSLQRFGQCHHREVINSVREFVIVWCSIKRWVQVWVSLQKFRNRLTHVDIAGYQRYPSEFINEIKFKIVPILSFEALSAKICKFHLTWIPWSKKGSAHSDHPRQGCTLKKNFIMENFRAQSNARIL